jgi:broad specificity phosphatase PhoE
MNKTTVFFLRTGKPNPMDNRNVLCQKGMDQATRAGNQLRAFRIDVILCSPLPYAYQTAKEVERLHLAHSPRIETVPELICAADFSEEAVAENLKKVMGYILEKFKRKSVLMVSHAMVGQAFLAHHIEESFEITKVHWPTIEHGAMVCREFIED